MFNSNKSILAFEELIGIILSIVAIVIFVLPILFSTFLNDSSNLQIAKDNAKSILNFINLKSDSDISEYTNCYILLKLKNLENFQIKKDKNIYNYLIDKNGIYLIKDSNLNKYIKKGFSNFNRKPDFKFNSKINIVFDSTKEPSNWNYLPFNSFEDINKLKIKKDHNYKILLIPNYDYVSLNEIGSTYQNKYKVYIYDENKRINEDRNLDSIFLAYRPDLNELFIVDNYFSSIILKLNLCIRSYLIDINKDEYYQKLIDKNDPEKLNYFNYEIKFLCVPKNENEIKGNFEYKSGVICDNKDSKINLCKGIKNDMTYLDFLNKFKDNCMRLTKESDIKIEIKKLKFEDIKEIKNIKFEDIFEKFDYNFYKNNKKYNLNLNYLLNNNYPDILKNEYEDFYKSHVFGYSFFKNLFGMFYNNKINGCYDSECNKFILLNGDIYFYLNNNINNINNINNNNNNNNFNFYKFKNYDILIRRGNNYYFNKKKVNIKKLDNFVKKDDKWFSDDVKAFYIFKININNKNYDVILTNKQYDQIREY